MSDTEDSDIDDEVITLLHKQQDMMIIMINEIDNSLEDLHNISHDIHHSQDLFTHLHLQETLQPFLQRWAAEHRITDDGLYITLTEEEQKEFNVPKAQITIYTICALLVEKKTGKPNK